MVHLSTSHPSAPATDRPPAQRGGPRAESTWQRALVTGASSGIGEALAHTLARTGADLILVGRNLTALERVADQARSRGAHVEIVCADLSDDHDIARLAAVIRDAEPMIDLLVNNAGIGRVGPLVSLATSDLHETMAVNNTALVQLTHAALVRMVDADRGCIVNISSAASRGPGPQHSVYVASKAFVTNFGQSLSMELRDTNVTCTTVLAGYTRTNYFERNGVTPEVPDAKWASPKQVARQVLDAARERRTLIITGTSHRWLRQLSTRYPNLTESYPVGKLRQLRVFLAGRRMSHSS